MKLYMWQGLIARLDTPTVDGRLLSTAGGGSRLSVPLHLDTELVGRVVSLDWATGDLHAKGILDSDALTPDVREAMYLGESMPCGVTIDGDSDMWTLRNVVFGASGVYLPAWSDVSIALTGACWKQTEDEDKTYE